MLAKCPVPLGTFARNWYTAAFATLPNCCCERGKRCVDFTHQRCLLCTKDWEAVHSTALLFSPVSHPIFGKTWSMLEGEKLKHLWCRLEQCFFDLVLLTFSKSLKEHLDQVLLVMSVQPGTTLINQIEACILPCQNSEHQAELRVGSKWTSRPFEFRTPSGVEGWFEVDFKDGANKCKWTTFEF